MTWLHLFAPGRSNHKEILLAWETWWKSAACGKSSVQRSSCFLATIPTPRFAKCFWMGGLSEFWSLFGEDHGPYYGPWSQIFKTHRNLPKPCKIWKIWKSLENTFNFKYRGTLPFENNKATFRLLNLKAPNLHGLFKALDLYSEIWNSQYLEGKTNKARFYMVGKDTPDFQSCTRGGGAVHSFLEIAVLSSLDFSKTGHSTPGKKSKPDINPLGLFQNRTFGPWKKNQNRTSNRWQPHEDPWCRAQSARESDVEGLGLAKAELHTRRAGEGPGWWNHQSTESH